MSTSKPQHAISARPMVATQESARTVALKNKIVKHTKVSPGLTYHADGNVSPGLSNVRAISKSISASIRDNRNTLNILPDMELAVQIIVSCIVAPNDMSTAQLTWTAEPPEMDPTLVGKFIDYLRDFFENERDIRKWLPIAVREAVATHGSYIIANIPESTLDDILTGRNTNVQSGLESISVDYKNYGSIKPLGLLNFQRGASTKSVAGLESAFMPNTTQTQIANDACRIQGTNVLINDNPDVIKLTAIMNLNRQLQEAQALGTNSKSPLVRAALESAVIAKRDFVYSDYLEIPGLDKASRAPIGHGLSIHVPSEACVPISIPGSPNIHSGYLFICDQYGAFVKEPDVDGYLAGIGTAHIQSVQTASGMLQRNNNVYNAYGGGLTTTSTVNQLFEVYSRIIERDLIERFGAGKGKPNIEIAALNELYHVMFRRELAGRYTQLVYMPAEMVSYLAYEYNDLGIGVSHLDKTRTLAAIRTSITMANVMATMRNSTNHRTLNITLEEDDPDPDATVARILSNYAAIQASSLPLDTTEPYSIIENIRTANTTVKVEGHPEFPTVGFDVNDSASGRVVVDTELMKLFGDQHIQSIGLSPEIVDPNAKNIDFASVAATSNALHNQRIVIKQDITNAFISDVVSKTVKTSGKLLSDLYQIYKEFLETSAKNAEVVKKIKEAADTTDDTETSEDTPGTITLDDDKTKVTILSRTVGEELNIQIKQRQQENKDVTFMEFVGLFLKHLRIELPKPDVTKVDQDMESLGKYSDALDKVLPAYISEQLVKPDNEDVDFQTVFETIKGIFLRQYIASRNILPEVRELLTGDKDNDFAINTLKDHAIFTDNLGDTIANIISIIKGGTTDGSDSTDSGYSGDSDTDDSSMEGFGDDGGNDLGADSTDTGADDSTTDSGTDGDDNSGSDEPSEADDKAEAEEPDAEAGESDAGGEEPEVDVKE